VTEQQTKIEPVVRTVTVNAPVERAFEVFTTDLKSWWPLERYSIAGDEEVDGVTAVDAVIEPRAGGRWYEVRSDGSEGDWAEIVVFDPPHRLVASWYPGRSAEDATEIEVRFTPDGDGTRVELTHRGWERIGERGPESREAYAGGWATVLAKYSEVAT
jgi:uncharacterized protein YndB with AHSA1/START domain